MSTGYKISEQDELLCDYAGLDRVLEVTVIPFSIERLRLMRSIK